MLVIVSKINHGVPKETVLGLIFFVLHINGTLNIIAKLCFANGIVILIRDK